ncbi:hypothetical protein [Granulicella tundricola]|uniref:Uncharacterized protein n=1 Tax=Granulicella tundricola (strain ATCC BAA-1859 / DSM 23138 / MP5ACTX9) TaxID=1198114 RepID=E8WVD2_GRATM|nr:hypothetical protein [Granulicella tundricola]ADW68380.1 hypothetical protein AciX9_1318 [Granulicella tundricola MP5ACTX9]
MSVTVLIKDANVYYLCKNGGDASTNHDLLALPGMAAVDFTGMAALTTFTISTKRSVVGSAAEWLNVSDDAFLRFKNGGKRLPSETEKLVVHDGGVALKRQRLDRESKPVMEGDVGPYARGAGNLKKGNLTTATNSKPTAWAVGTAGTPAYFETDPSHPNDLNRDHQNNAASLKKRKRDDRDGMTIAIPQWIHMNGYTFGNKAKAGKIKKGTTLSRTEWISQNPSPAFFKEVYQTIRFYADSGNLTYETVGSYRYLYKRNTQLGTCSATSDLDQLFMHYLGLAT